MAPPIPLVKNGQRPASRLWVRDPRKAIGPDDLFAEQAVHTAPRIARFLAHDGSPRIGLVLKSSEGLPRRLLDLTARHGLGPGLLDLASAGGFEVAERELAQAEAGADGSDEVTLEPEELPHRLLSPVDIDGDQIERGTRLVLGFGLTFQGHRKETGGARPFVFPKPTVPTGACVPVVAGNSGDGPVALLDYEIELGCVALKDIDLDRLDQVDPAAHFGYLVINDVTAREPILRNRRFGYTKAKARPTYLPCGPWLVPGTHFIRDPPTLRRMVLTVSEATTSGGGVKGEHDPGGHTDGHTHTHTHTHTLRQDAGLEELTLGLRELLGLVSQRRALTMPDLDGRPWPISVERDGRRIVPAGSLLLTGTPGGTAIRSPNLADRARLVFRCLRYLHWPSDDYRRHLEDHRHVFGFLSPGDRVSGWITGLGRQEWEVR